MHIRTIPIFLCLCLLSGLAAAQDSVHIAKLALPEDPQWQNLHQDINVDLNQVDSAFTIFQNQFDVLKKNIHARTGKEYYLHAINIESGTIIITATNDWYRLPESHRRISSRALHRKWSLARHNASPAILIIQDISGQRQQSLSRQ